MDFINKKTTDKEDPIKEGLKNGIIAFDDEQKNITYFTQEPRRRRYTDPEEQVQAIIFCRLVIQYGYSPTRITINEKVTMGVTVKEADIIVYNDDALTQPHIVVECKKEDISEAEFRQAVNQAFAYAHAIAGTTKFVWVTKGDKDEFYKFDKNTNRQEEEPDIPHFGQMDTPPFRFVKGQHYKTKQGQIFALKDLETIDEHDLIRIFKQSHDALWAGGELNPSQAFDELDKLIFCKIWDEKKTLKGQPYKFQIYKEESPEQLKARIDDLYLLGKKQDPEIFNKPIDLSAERVQTIIRYLQKINLTDTELDSKGKAFETFLGTYFRGEFGQYFTPRNVVKMILDILPINNESKVLDTSCGSGGFLLYALDKVRQQANQLFNVKDPKELENNKDILEHRSYWHDFAEKNLFGIEINEQIARVAKMNMIIHDDGHTNVIAFDGLNPIDLIQEKNAGFAANSFDFIVTNPPFGSIVKQSEKSYMQVDKVGNAHYDFALKEVNWIDEAAKGRHLTTGRENQNTEILFIEQCYNFLKEGGYLAAVIPDGILTNSSLQYVRNGIEQKFRIVAVVSLPATTFTHTGAGVKSSVLVLKKYPLAQTLKIKSIQSDLQEELAESNNLAIQYKTWEAARRDKLKPLLKLKDEASLALKTQINEEFSEKWNTLVEQTEEAYQIRRQKTLPKYPIFMAIAEYIGYDATGKTISQNDLPEITNQLASFIQSIENNNTPNFR